MKIKNIAFFGVMASILSVAGANAAATNETIIASKAYVDRSLPTKTSQLTNDSGYATTTQVATAKSEAISAAATDATTKANAKVSSATTISSSSTTTAPNEKAVSTALSGKASASDLTSHTGNGDIHVTAAQKTEWSGKQNAITEQNKLPAALVDGALTSSDISGKANTDLGNITTAGNTVIQNQAKSVAAQGTYSASTNYGTGTVGAAIKSKADTSALESHTGNTTVHITAAERTAWNAKQNAITSTNKLPAANVSGLATVATSGKASDLNNDAGFLKAADISGKADKATNLAASGTTNKIVQYNDQGIIVAGTTAGSAATKNATDSYVATGTDVTTGKAVTAALGTLDVATITTSGKPIVSVGETDGKITASSGNINVSSVNGPTIGINTGETSVTCSSDAPCVLSYDGAAYSWTRFAY